MSDIGLLISAIVSGIIAVLGAIGNAGVIYVFVKVPTVRTVNNVFVVQLAVVDFVKATCVLTMKVVNQSQQRTSMHPVVCPIFGMLRAIGSCQSALLLAVIAVVRYWKVIYPHRFHVVFSKKRTVVYCGSLILGTFLLSLLPIVGIGEYKYSFSHGACFVDWSSKNIAFRSIYYSLNVGLPFPVLVFCYYNIFKALREHRRRVAPELGCDSRQSRTSDSSNPFVTQVFNIDQRLAHNLATGRMRSASGNAKLSPQMRTQNSRVRANTSPSLTPRRSSNDFEIVVTKVMFAIVIAYVICRIPAFVTTILGLSKLASISADVWLLAVTLVDLKVFLNPLIYMTSHKRFRTRALTALKQLQQV